METQNGAKKNIKAGLVTSDAGAAEAFYSFLTDDTLEAIEDGDPFTVIGARDCGIACGAMAGFIDDDMFIITSLYVSPAHRRKEAASAMLDVLCAILPPDTPVRVDLPLDAEEGSEEFFTAMGFDPYIPVDGIYRAPFSALFHSSLLKKDISSNVPITTFSKCPDRILSVAQSRARTINAPMPQGGFFDPAIDRNLSYICMKDECLIAYLITETIGSSSYVTGLYCENSRSMALMRMLQLALADGLSQHYDDDQELIVPVTNTVSSHLVNSLLPELKPAVKTFYRI